MMSPPSRLVSQWMTFVLVALILAPTLAYGWQATGRGTSATTKATTNQRPQSQSIPSHVYYTSIAKNRNKSTIRSSQSSAVGFQRNPQDGGGLDDTTSTVAFQRDNLEPFTLAPPATISPAVVKETDPQSTPTVIIETPASTVATVTSSNSSSKAATGKAAAAAAATTVSRSTLVNLSCMLAMNSGFLNGVGLSGVLGKVGSISAVTGTFTNAAVAYSIDLSPVAMGAVLVTPLCYMLGSALNGWWNYQTTQGLDMAQLTYGQTRPLIVAGTLVTLANMLLQQQVVAPSVALAMLTFAVGMQNSWTSMILQGNLLRTAHFSGIVSDFGTVLGQVLHGNTANAFKLPMFGRLAVSFWMGGMMSVLGVRKFGILTASNCLMASSLLYLGLWTSLTQPIRYMLRQWQRKGQAALYQQLIRKYRTRFGLISYWWKETHRWQRQKQQQRRRRRRQWSASHA